MEITKDFLIKNHAPLLQELQADAIRAAVEQATKDAKAAQQAAAAAGAASELERIRGVLASELPGHEALVREMMLDGQTSAGDAAARVLAAERESRARDHAGRADDAAKARVPGAVPPTPTPTPAPADDDAPVEVRARAQWDKKKRLREEFGGDFDNYLAYVRASESGRVRMIGGRA